MKNRFTQLLAFVLLAGINAGWNKANAQTTHLLKDLVTEMEGSNPGGSYPDAFATINGVLYFAGRDKTAGPNNGHIVYKTDGTTAGTEQVKVIQTPVTIYGGLISGFVDFNGTVLFINKIQTSHYELWKTDGTEAGTELLKAFSNGDNADQSRPQAFTVMGNTMYFYANNGNGMELWKTDGTTAGTVEVVDMYPGAPGGILQMEMKAMNGKVYFSGLTGLPAAVKGLYASDGSTTDFVKNISGGTIKSLTVFDNNLYFINSGTLWKSDGTNAGTAIVAGVGDVNSLLVFKNGLYASGDVSLYKIDGNTNPVLANNTGAFTGANNDYFFTKKTYWNGSALVTDAYRSDGTPGGTVTVPHDVGTTASFYVYNNKMYTARVDSGTFNSNLWETDGTVAGTKRYPTGQPYFGIVNDRIIFLKYDVSVGIEPHYMEMAGGPTPTAPSAPSNLTATPTNSIELNWKDNANNEDSFYVEYTQDTVAGNWTQIASLASNVETYLHSGLNPGEDYYYRVRAHNTVGNSAYSNIAGATEPTTAIGELDIFNALTVYPNPANEMVNIANIPNGSTLKILNITGTLVYSSAIANEQISINTKDFVSGMYIIRIENTGIAANKKLIVD